MDNMKLTAKILLLISESENEGKHDPMVYSESCLKCPQRQIDACVIRLKNAGYVDGLYTTENIDNCEDSVLWGCSKPRLTLAGVEYMSSNDSFRKAKEELRKFMAESTGAFAAHLLTNALNR